MTRTNLAASLLLAALLLLGSIVVDPAPRSGQTTSSPTRDLSGLRAPSSAAQSGAPHLTEDFGLRVLGNPAIAGRLGRSVATGNPSEPEPATSPGEDRGAPQPTAGIGTALFSASATWCAPTRTQCLRWGGHALLAALPTYSGHPYVVRVWRGSRHVDVTVVSICGCGIDLSPWAFQQLEPLSRGRIDVEVEGPIGPLPATDVLP